jgi:hypothetical protein
MVGPAMPALLTSTSIFPSSERVFFKASRTEALSETSTFSDPLISQISTLAPEARRRSAIAAPMPILPPVTTAVRPLKSSWFTAARERPG